MLNTPWGYTLEMDTRWGYRIRGGGMTVSEYLVTGMTCGHCEASVREEVGEIEGITDVQVSHETGKLVVTAEGEIDDNRVFDAVQEAGYSAERV